MSEKAKRAESTRLSNTVAFVISLVAALLLCFYVKAFDSTMSTRYIDVKVSVIGTKELASINGFSLPDEFDLTIELELSGRRSDLNSLKASDITAFVDVSGVSVAGYNNLPVNVSLPNGIELAKPIASVNLFLDSYQVKTVPVVASHTIGSFVSGVYLGYEYCNPSFISVSGPTSVLSEISYALVSYSVTEFGGNVVAHCAPELFFKDGTAVKNPYVSYDTNDIVVSLEAYKLKEVPVVAKLLTDGSSIALGNVTVKGDVDTVSSIDKITVGVDESSFDSAPVREYFIESLLPDNVSLANESDTSFMIAKRVIEIGDSDIVFTAENVYAFTGVKVTVYGKADTVMNMSKSDLTAEVDASKIYSDSEGNLYGNATVSCRTGNVIIYYDGTIRCTMPPSGDN